MDEDDQDLDNLLDAVLECPGCGADQQTGEALLGVLGQLSHYRCRYCGWQWSDTEDDVPPN